MSVKCERLTPVGMHDNVVRRERNPSNHGFAWTQKVNARHRFIFYQAVLAKCPHDQTTSQPHDSPTKRLID